MSSLLTKRALEASLKRLLLEKPLSKITISDITDDCGISRMTFYYHFQDIYDLVEWSCGEDAAQAIAGNKTASTWQTGLLDTFLALRENKPFIMSIYHDMSREQLERFLVPVVSDLVKGVVDGTCGAQARTRARQGLHRTLFSRTRSSERSSTGLFEICVTTRSSLCRESLPSRTAPLRPHLPASKPQKVMLQEARAVCRRGRLCRRRTDPVPDRSLCPSVQSDRFDKKPYRHAALSMGAPPAAASPWNKSHRTHPVHIQRKV